MAIDRILRQILESGDGIEVYKKENGNMGVTFIPADDRGERYFTFELTSSEISEFLRLIRGMSRSMKLLGKKRGPRPKKAQASA